VVVRQRQRRQVWLAGVGKARGGGNALRTAVFSMIQLTARRRLIGDGVLITGCGRWRRPAEWRRCLQGSWSQFLLALPWACAAIGCGFPGPIVSALPRPIPTDRVLDALLAGRTNLPRSGRRRAPASEPFEARRAEPAPFLLRLPDGAATLVERPPVSPLPWRSALAQCGRVGQPVSRPPVLGTLAQQWDGGVLLQGAGQTPLRTRGPASGGQTASGSHPAGSGPAGQRPKAYEAGFACFRTGDGPELGEPSSSGALFDGRWWERNA